MMEKDANPICDSQMRLTMRYFVLKPRAEKPNDKYAIASQQAMLSYAFIIRPENPELADDLEKWARGEQMKMDAIRDKMIEGENG